MSEQHRTEAERKKFQNQNKQTSNALINDSFIDRGGMSSSSTGCSTKENSDFERLSEQCQEIAFEVSTAKKEVDPNIFQP